MTSERCHSVPNDVAAGVPADTIFALTSVPPVIRDVAAQRACIRSWVAAGLQVRTFNHTSEVGAIRRQLDVEVVPVPDSATSATAFGKRYVTIKTMLDWAAERNVRVLLINADIELQLAPWELQRARWLADGGLCYIIRHNHDGDLQGAVREAHGIDAFLLHGRDASLFQSSHLSMGVPFWDYWLPQTFLKHHRPLRSVEYPVAFHRSHPEQWRWEIWYRCALEFARMAGTLGTDQSFAFCQRMASAFRRSLQRERIPLRQRPTEIAAWVRNRFRQPGSKTFVQLGARAGKDTDCMAALPGAVVHAFELDPRNGPALDGHAARSGLATVDFVWAESQGGAGDMIEGGRKTLSKTRYLYTQYGGSESYGGRMTLGRILEMLPEFRVVELWAEHVLLENRSLA